MIAVITANILMAVITSPHLILIVAAATAAAGTVALIMPTSRTSAERRLRDMHARSRDGPAPAGSGIGGARGRYQVAADDGTDHRTGIMAVIASAVAALRGGATIRDAFPDTGNPRQRSDVHPGAHEGADSRLPANTLTEQRLYDLLSRRALSKETDRQIADAATQIALAARLSGRIGCPAVRCLEAVEQSHRRSRLLADSREQALAVPQATIRLLSALPAVTVLLGELMGAHPIGFLFGTPAGLGCLLLGGGFHAAGMAWTAAMLSAADDEGR